ILFHAYMNESQSRIADNCAFVFEDSFNAEHHLEDLGYIGILAINIGGIEVKNSEFKNEQNSELFGIESDRGIGVLSWHAPMRIGTGDESEQNHFVKLYKGIDAYSTSTVLGFMLIEGNRFEEVTKGIHLQHNHFSSVVGNRFEKMSGENGYGLYAQKAEGLTIANNVFEAGSVATEAAPMWGAIVENSGYYGCTVYNNEFVKLGEEDKFFAAIQFEGDNNPNTLIDCNRFEPVSRYDLLLLEDKNRHFSEEGGCDEFDPLISPLKNEWHTLCDNVETYHLYHDNAEAAINWTFVPGFAPNCYSNNFQPIVCDDDDNDCSLGGFGKLGGKDEDDILNNLETAITTQEHSLVISQLVRYHLKTNELTTAIRTLQQDKQKIPTNSTTQVLNTQIGEAYQLPAFNAALVKKQIAPKKLQSEGEMSNDFLPKQTIVYTNSNNSHSIRTSNTDVILENRHLKVKFNRIVNHFEGMNVAVIISDINGRVVHHEQIEGGHDEYLIDRELIVNEKYVCSLWVNGTLVKSRKIVVLN
ncbi:MAG: NosD domain-containing protein, partial [Chitinophagales bacterium]